MPWPAGRLHSKETKAKMAVSQREHLARPEIRAKLTHARHQRSTQPWPKGSKHSIMTRAKMSVSQSARCAANPVSLATRQKLSLAITGLKRPYRPKTAIHRERISVAIARWLAHWPRPCTNLERALHGLLTSAGMRHSLQRRFGRYVVDAYVPNRKLVFEADGSFWHQDKQREARRDAYLLARSEIVAVVHLTEQDLSL